MAKNYNQSCDNCGTILYGQDRGAFVKKDNIFVNGQVGKNVVDPESQWHDVKYMTRSSDQQSVFCDTECLREWMDLQEQLWDNRKKAKLREEAETGQTGVEPPHRGFNQRVAYSSGPGDDRPRPRKEYGAGPPAPAPEKGTTRQHIGLGGEITEIQP